MAGVRDDSSARSGMSSVTRGTVLMLIGTLGFVAQGFISRVILVRALTPAQWGQFSLGLALAGLLASVGPLGLNQAIARSLPFSRRDDERRAMVRSAFSVVIASAVGLSIAMYAFGAYVGAIYHDPSLALTLELFAGAAGVTIASTMIASVFQGFEDVVPNALFINIVNPGLFIVFLVASVKLTPTGDHFPGALAAYLVAAIATSVVLALYARRRLRRRLPAGPHAEGEAARLFRFAAPLFLVSVMGYLTGNTDTLILGIYQQANVGYYTAALSLARLVLVGVGALSYIYLPVAARFLREGDRDSIGLTYVTATKWMVLLSLPLFVLFVFLPGDSLAFVYGPAYRSTTLPLVILVIGAFLATLTGPAASTQVSFGQTRLLVYNNAITGAVDVVLALALIPPYGLVGAAVAWACANALNATLSMVELALLSGVHPLRAHYLVPVVGTAAPFMLLFGLVPVSPPWWALPGIGLGVAAVFIVVVFLTASVDRGDRLVLEVFEGMIGRRLEAIRSLARWRLALSARSRAR